MSNVEKYNIHIYEGETWGMNLALYDDNDDPVLLTGYTAKMQIRDRPGGTVFKTIDNTSGITVNEAYGELDLFLSAEETAEFNFKKASYDIFIYSPADEAVPILCGDVIVERRITE